jgi:anti-sigma regulatory factor (Ser/Thr protein kinase)
MPNTLRGDATTSASSELCLPARPSMLYRAREYAQQTASAFGLDADSCYEFVLAVNEAVTNAIRHGSPNEQGDIHLSVLTDGDRLTLTVRDYGTFTRADPDSDTMSESGRGLSIMARSMDAVQLSITSANTSIRLSKTREATHAVRGR